MFVTFNQAGFAKAMKMVEEEFLETVSYFKDVWLPARTIVQSAIEKRYEVSAEYNSQLEHNFECT